MSCSMNAWQYLRCNLYLETGGTGIRTQITVRIWQSYRSLLLLKPALSLLAAYSKLFWCYFSSHFASPELLGSWCAGFPSYWMGRCPHPPSLYALLHIYVIWWPIFATGKGYSIFMSLPSIGLTSQIGWWEKSKVGVAPKSFYWKRNKSNVVCRYAIPTISMIVNTWPPKMYQRWEARQMDGEWVLYVHGLGIRLWDTRNVPILPRHKH